MTAAVPEVPLVIEPKPLVWPLVTTTPSKDLLANEDGPACADASDEADEGKPRSESASLIMLWDEILLGGWLEIEFESAEGELELPILCLLRALVNAGSAIDYYFMWTKGGSCRGWSLAQQSNSR